jgi:hypothetical protein
MLQNLMVGSVLVALTVLAHTIGLMIIAAATPRLARKLGFHSHGVGRTLVMTGTVLGLLAILTLEVWGWAIAYQLLGTTRNFEDALYLSTVMFSTIGYGELALNPAWRLLTGLEGIDGFLMIGWSTAYLVRAATLHGPFRADHF